MHYPAVSVQPAGIFTGGVVFISAIQLPAAIVNGYNSFWSYFNHMYPRWVCSALLVIAKSRVEEGEPINGVLETYLYMSSCYSPGCC